MVAEPQNDVTSPDHLSWIDDDDDDDDDDDQKNKSWPTWPHQQPRCGGKQWELRPFTNLFLFLLLFLLSFNPCLEVATRGMSLLWACKLPTKTPKLASQLGYPEIFNFQGGIHWLISRTFQDLIHSSPHLPSHCYVLGPGHIPVSFAEVAVKLKACRFIQSSKCYNGSGGMRPLRNCSPISTEKPTNISSEVSRTSPGYPQYPIPARHAMTSASKASITFRRSTSAWEGVSDSQPDGWTKHLQEVPFFEKKCKLHVLASQVAVLAKQWWRIRCRNVLDHSFNMLNMLKWKTRWKPRTRMFTRLSKMDQPQWNHCAFVSIFSADFFRCSR